MSRGKHRRAKAGTKPPSSEIAAYAVENIECRNCHAQPGTACPVQGGYKTACTERFADAASIYVPIWKQAQREKADGEHPAAVRTTDEPPPWD